MRYLTAFVVVVVCCMAGCSSSVQQPQDVPGDVVAGDTRDDSDVVAPDAVGVDVRLDIPVDVMPDTYVDVPCDPQCGYKTCGPSACPGVYCGECGYGSCCSPEGQCTCCPSCVVADSCGDWECGDSACLDQNGTAIPCGYCEVGTVCNQMVFRCFPECIFPDGLPITWGRSGVVNYMRVPVTVEEKTTCFDYTGDGLGDCGLTGLASELNPALADMIAKASTAIILEFAAVEDFVTTADFTLKGLQGAPVVAGTLVGDMTVEQSSYMEDTCLPFIFFEDSSIASGALSTGPGNFRISVSLSVDLNLTINLIDTRIKTGVLVADDTGVAAPDGILSGVVTKADLTVILDDLQAECDREPQPDVVKDICPYVTVARGAMSALCDLHLDKSVASGYVMADAENPGDAASICLHFTLAAANIVGYTPQ